VFDLVDLRHKVYIDTYIDEAVKRWILCLDPWKMSHECW